MGFLKRVAVGSAVIVGVAHIGVLGHLIRVGEVSTVTLPPVNDYTSYRIVATRDGYTIEYIGNDPRVLQNDTEVDGKPGFFGIGGSNRTRTVRQFTQDGSRNTSGEDDEGKLSAQDIACIEAAGGGRSNGALVGGSVAATAAPALMSIPYVGWLAAGWATLLGTDIGGNVGATVATTIKGC